MPDLLFEIGTEELPSWYVDEGRAALVQFVLERLTETGLAPESVRGYSTPRRLAVLAAGVPEQSEAREELRRGPAAEVAFDDSGRPTKAARGFAAANGVEPAALEIRDTDRGRYVFARLTRGGQAAASVIPPLLARAVEELPAPRKMRWSDVETPFMRPVHWLLALLGDAVLEVEAAGVRSADTSRGHRFLAPGEVRVASAADYVETLRGASVLVDTEERDRATWGAANEAAAPHGLVASGDAALRAEVRNLVELPIAVLGSFDEAYLELPDEVLSTVMIHHQRFFPTHREDGALARHFVGISNNRVSDVGIVREGYEQVLAGRLYDARFFWDADRRKSLSQHAWGLSGIAFQKDLGSMADKIARVSEVAASLAEALQLPKDERGALDQALPIFRADLSTDMVYEFPELEGVMARAYARAEGMPEQVATALEDGVLPKGPGDRLPATRIGAVLAVADRLDKVVGFFALGKRPSGSADPFALRRDGLALARVLNAEAWRLPLETLVLEAAAPHRSAGLEIPKDVEDEVERFLWDRVASLLAEQGMAVQVVRAAVQGSRNVIDAARRAYLLRALMAHAEFPALMALHKRAANLARQEDRRRNVKPGLFRNEFEAPLFEALPAARRGVEGLLAAVRGALPGWDLAYPPDRPLEDLGGGVAAVLALKAPLDAFLDNVLVMVDEAEVRGNRLALLREVTEVLRELGALDQLEGV
ncbi:MAG TPA: glycine--tRNA ligase subunit beta [Trueperaceae bacterium]|nr:glycine--tRNA ligase subunit beta [Trueperaceae bacterium]